MHSHAPWGKQTTPFLTTHPNPPSAVCTGTAPASFVTPGPAATTAASYVPNVYFSFPYIATYFANPGHCSAALSQCSANHAACITRLGGGGGGVGGELGVTIVVPGGGGTTIAAGGGVTYAAASATSICKIPSPSPVLEIRSTACLPTRGGAGNSLATAACDGLHPSMCTLSGTSTAGFFFGTDPANAAARPTAAAAAACAGLVGAVAAGVAGLGIL